MSVVYKFRWNEQNEDHITEHNVSPGEAEYVVNHPVRGFPRSEGNGKYRVWGQTAAGRYLQVVYIFDPPGIARELSNTEQQQLSRRRRRRRS